jgi:hypothetical protein
VDDGESVVASYVGGYTLGQPWIQEDVGIYGSAMYATKITNVWGLSTASYSYLNQTPSSFVMHTNEYGDLIKTVQNTIIMPTVLPRDSSSALGGWSSGWKYLYLQDTDGDVWQMSLTPTGVIVLGKL